MHTVHVPTFNQFLIIFSFFSRTQPLTKLTLFIFYLFLLCTTPNPLAKVASFFFCFSKFFLFLKTNTLSADHTVPFLIFFFFAQPPIRSPRLLTLLFFFF